MTEYRCVELARFRATDLETVQRAFQKATKIPLGQSWLPQQEAAFAPADVFIAWRGKSLLVFAELTDADISTDATAPNQKLWELGDVFEMFLCPVGQSAYFEFHVAPNDQWLQLRFADSTVVDDLRKTGDFTKCLIAEKVFQSTVWLRPKQKKWFVLVEIPAEIVCESRAALKRGVWNFSFSRYDYTRRTKTRVISSTSPHKKPNFHARKEWSKMQFAKHKA